MATVNELEQEFYATLMGMERPWPSIVDLRYMFYLGVSEGTITIGGGSSPAEIQTAVDDYLTANPVAATTNASSLTSGTLDAARLPATVVIDTELLTGLGGKADTSHTHSTSQVTGLDDVLAGKSPTGHTHLAAQVTDLQTFVDGRLSTVVAGAPAAFDTLIEIGQRIEAESSEGDAIVATLATKAPINSPTFTGTVSGVTKSMVGLANVDNTSDLAKPVSTAQQAALDAKAPITVNMSTKTGTTYTLALADSGSGVETNNAAANTITVPPNSSVAFPIGTIIALRQYGTGQTSVVAGAGVIIRSRDSALKFTGQYSEAALTKRSTDEWVLSGDVMV